MYVIGHGKDRHRADPDIMEVNGSIFFHFHGGRTVPELSPEAYGCQGPLGTNELYWS